MAAGLGGAWGLTRYLKSMVFGVTVLDGATFAIMPVVLASDCDGGIVCAGAEGLARGPHDRSS